MSAHKRNFSDDITNLHGLALHGNDASVNHLSGLIFITPFLESFEPF